LARTFRWQAFFRRAADPVFVLDRRRRLLFVNEAWEALTGTPASEAHLLFDRRPRPGDSPRAALEHALTPPPEAVQGAVARVRRLAPGREAGRRWWDVEFFPLRQPGEAGGVLLLGRITPVPADEAAPDPPLPEQLVALRERVADRYGTDLLPETTPALRRLAEQVRLAARTAAPVWLVGEPGAGKRTLARLIHLLGPNRERPLAALDCARLPVAAVADVLFSGGPGAPAAVYLNEPGRLPRDVQARLCELVAAPDGGAPRVLAGCAADPAEEVRSGRLLDELYASLAVLTLHVPPLRERAADLPLLVRRLLERWGEDEGPRVTGLTAEAWEALRGHAWPGNLRELFAVLAAARRRAKNGRIDAADLPASLRLTKRLGETPGRAPERPLPLDRLLEQAEKRLIELALRRTGGHKARAAEALAIWRTRLTRRMKALGIAGAEDEPTIRLELDEDAGEA
jgi:transcriptional regulator with AAA-type ATPase domain